MKSMAERKTLQIMPASGWAGVFLKDGDEVAVSLVGWALVEDAYGRQTVVGLACNGKQVALCDTITNFVGYVLDERMPDLLFPGDEKGDDESGGPPFSFGRSRYD